MSAERLPTLDEIASVAQICKAAIAYESQVRFYMALATELENANASLQHAVIDAERTITRLQRELADVTRERDRLRAVTRRAKSGQRRRARVRARA
jgi:hypothetical protein